MGELRAQTMDAAEQTTTFDNGKAEVVTVDGSAIRRFTFQPGWRWSESVKTLAGTETCQTHHVGYVISGHLHVVTEDGSEQDIRAGDAYNIPPGHDGWIVGDETFMSVEFPDAQENRSK
jgi:mannose-6-phosphate isomerase-like protein (cupin superfamily)